MNHPVAAPRRGARLDGKNVSSMHQNASECIINNAELKERTHRRPDFM
jgi:hypothetical protein